MPAYYHPLLTNPWYVREYAGPIDITRALFKDVDCNEAAWGLVVKPDRRPARPLSCFCREVQAVGLNVDDDPLIVARFMKERKFNSRCW